jgi:hypothetical protein
VKKFLTLADGSAILPAIGPNKPPIGLYILILTAVSPMCRNALVLAAYSELNAYSQVERAFKSFIDGTFKAPPQFSNEFTWQSLEDFRVVLARLEPEHWCYDKDSFSPFIYHVYYYVSVT